MTTTPDTDEAPDKPAEDGANASAVVLVPVGSAAAVRRTAPIAALLAAASGGVITFLTVRQLRYDMVGRPDRVPDWLNETVSKLDLNGISIEVVARLGQSVVGAIEDTARELEASTLVLHWESDEVTIPGSERAAFAQLFAQPPCTALLLRGRFEPSGTPSILVAGSGERATGAAIETATALLAATGGGELRMLEVLAPNATDAEIAEASEASSVDLRESHHGVRTVVVARAARSREGAVLELLAEEPADLAIVAAPREGVIRSLSRTRLPQRLLQPAPTPVLIVNRPEARPLTWFHRMWNPVYQRLPKQTEEEKIATYMQLRRAARANVDYYVLMALAAAVATLGLLLDSAAVVIGAMLIAPLMSPIAGSALGVVQGDAKLLRLSIGSVLSGTAAAIGVAVVVAYALPGTEPTSEFTARTEPGLLDLLVALGSGVAAAYTLSRPGLSAALPGVAVAAALVPPLASVSVGIVLAEWQDAAGAGLLFGTNLVAIAAASALTFLWLGFRPDADRADRFGVFGRGVAGLFALLLVVAIPIGVLSARALESDARAADAEQAITQVATTIGGLELASLEVTNDVGSEPLTVRARLLAEQAMLPEHSEALRAALERALGEPVRLEIEVTQLLRDGP